MTLWYESDVAKPLMEKIKVYAQEFQRLLNDPDGSIAEMPADVLFELFSEAFRVKSMWANEADDPEVLVIKGMLSGVVDFLCAEIVRRHKEGIL